MSKVDTLKKQYPELGISVVDLLVRLDDSKTNKYLPLLCKIFSSRYNVNEGEGWTNEVLERLKIRGIDTEGLSTPQAYFIYMLVDNMPTSYFDSFKEFKDYMERGLIENKDVLTYNTVDEIQQAVGMAVLKSSSKNLEKQVIKEYEDEKYLIVRPLTFEASVKYGAGTKWCTTSTNDKQYFTRYWSKGVLAYIINKEDGVKYRMFYSLHEYDKELSFWNAADNRIDFLEMEIDEKLYSTIKQLTKSDKTNESLCNEELADNVWKECDYREWTQRQLKKRVKETANEMGETLHVSGGLDLAVASENVITLNNYNEILGREMPSPVEETIQITRRQLEELIDQHVNNAIRTSLDIPQVAR